MKPLNFCSLIAECAYDKDTASTLLQALHDKEALEGITHQLPTYMTSAENPLCLGCARAAPARSDSHSDTDSDGSAESADESGGEGSCPFQQHTKQQAPEFRSHMEYGSMEPLEDTEQEQEPSKVEQEVAKCMEQLHKLEEAYEQLILTHPHGVPVSELAAINPHQNSCSFLFQHGSMWPFGFDQNSMALH